MNKRNVLRRMDEHELFRFQGCIGYSFKEKSKLKRALSHSSLKGEGIQHSNERLEFLGDAILGHCVADKIFHTLQDADESELTRKHHDITNGKNLARIGLELGIEKVIEVGGSLQGKSLPDSIIEDAVEALIGAIFDDGGMDEARSFIDRIVFDDRRLARALSQGDPITELKELCERTGTESQYEEEEKVIDGETLFFVRLRWKEREAVGIGKSKKEAERLASAVILDDSKHP